MHGKRACTAFVALLIATSLALPETFASAIAVPRPSSLIGPVSQDPHSGEPGVVTYASTSVSSDPPQGSCFGYNHVNDSFIPKVIKSLRIAVVQPILTSTPYSQYEYGSFYAFYAKELGVNATVTTNLDLLSTNVSSGYGYNKGWGLSYGLYQFLTSQAAVDCGLEVGRNVQLLTDMNVSDGALFFAQNRTARYDVVVLPFSEYVTAQEYTAYEDFVAGGGTLLMDGHSLEYPVTYNATTNMETLVYGHGWAFNGTYASPIACSSNDYGACPWFKSNNDWVGSNTCEASCFHNYVFNGSVVNQTNILGRALSDEFGGTVFKSYVSHEEDTLTNRTDTSIVSVFANDSRNLITAYTHQFRKGSVVCMCVFGDDIIGTDQSAQYFMLLGIVSGGLGPAATCSSAPASPGVTCTVAVVGWNPTGTVYWKPVANSSFSPQMCTLSSGSCSVKILDSGPGPLSAALTYSGDSLNAQSSKAFTLTASASIVSSTSSSATFIASTTATSTPGGTHGSTTATSTPGGTHGSTTATSTPGGTHGSTTAAPQAPGAYPIGLIAVGGLVAVAVVACAVILSRRRKNS